MKIERTPRERARYPLLAGLPSPIVRAEDRRDAGSKNLGAAVMADGLKLWIDQL